MNEYTNTVLKLRLAKDKDMFKVSQDGQIFSKTIKVYMDEAPFKKNPEDLLTLEFGGGILTKDVTTKSPFDEDIEIIDVKLDCGFGPREDVWYSTLPLLIKNVRRGNTIIKKTENGGFSYSLGRKGLMKFFDMRLSYINKQERNMLDVTKNGTAITLEKNYILAPVLNSLKNGNQVQVLKTLKANGENV